LTYSVGWREGDITKRKVEKTKKSECVHLRVILLKHSMYQNVFKNVFNATLLKNKNNDTMKKT